ncbi:MAG: EamA family transporter [Candidatus Bathyarchaeota archaeon]|nr:EamA family transporter [Candidatus Bathyarchaeota archaeon A05DMB-5]MDH7557180.1 EamA family transporter [Candidatus Bathyarchaeota archaeon]
MKIKVVTAFLAVYLIWGSTYLAIRFVIESLPPFFMAGTRFLVAGAILYIFARLRGVEGETKGDWSRAFVLSGLMLLGGHGAVVWAEQWVPSGLACLLVGTVPLWMVFLDWMWNKHKPNVKVVGGVVLGFVGVILLVGGVESLGASSVDLAGAGIIVFGTFLWANGSLYSRSAKQPRSQLLATALEMVAGGLLLFLVSLATGELSRVRLDLISMRSLVSWIYLVVFGALVAFTCYIWLLKVTTPAKVSTYAYVNPIVAMFLGWALANEPITTRNVAAATIILTAVAIITAYEAHKKNRKTSKNSAK